MSEMLTFCIVTMNIYTFYFIQILLIKFFFSFDFPSQTTLPLLHPCAREYSSVHTQQPAKPVREVELDPYILLDDDIKYVTQDIRDVSINRLIWSCCFFFLLEQKHHNTSKCHQRWKERRKKKQWSFKALECHLFKRMNTAL